MVLPRLPSSVVSPPGSFLHRLPPISSRIVSIHPLCLVSPPSTCAAYLSTPSPLCASPCHSQPRLHSDTSSFFHCLLVYRLSFPALSPWDTSMCPFPILVPLYTHSRSLCPPHMPFSLFACFSALCPCATPLLSQASAHAFEGEWLCTGGHREGRKRAHWII